MLMCMCEYNIRNLIAQHFHKNICMLTRYYMKEKSESESELSNERPCQIELGSVRWIWLDAPLEDNNLELAEVD